MTQSIRTPFPRSILYFGRRSRTGLVRAAEPTYDRVMPYVVAAAIMLDWVPGYYLNLDSETFSLLKFIVLPCILLDFLLKPKSYMKGSQVVYGWVYLVGLVIGIGGAITAGTNSSDRIVELLPTALILLYFVRARDRLSAERLLRIISVSSLLVSINMILSFFGIITPSQVVDNGKILRIWAGVSSSTLGLFCVFPAATLGLLMLKPKNSPVTVIVAIGSLAMVLVAIAGTLISGQRIATFAISACALISFTTYLLRYPGRSRKRVLGSIALILLALALNRTLVDQISQTFLYRTGEISSDPEESGLNLRMGFWSRFLHELTSNPQIVAPGMGNIERDLGVRMHLIWGEAYYEGGLILLLVITVLFVKAIASAWREMKRDMVQNRSSFGMSLLVTMLGFVLILALDPGLHTRLVYMMFGICISLTHSDAIDRKTTTVKSGVDRRAMQH